MITISGVEMRWISKRISIKDALQIARIINKCKCVEKRVFQFLPARDINAERYIIRYALSLPDDHNCDEHTSDCIPQIIYDCWHGPKGIDSCVHKDNCELLTGKMSRMQCSEYCRNAVRGK